jgi:ubiquinone/menaquinone biosynthesis C-methylase UbiE
MHRMHNTPKTTSGPETTGITLHWASQYDIFTGLMGLGVNRPNSRMVVELAKIKPGDKVLDVGCGTGNLTLTAKTVAGASGSVYGIDPSPEMIDVARKKARRIGSEAVFDIGVVEKIAFPEATFDVVISRLVIHHLPGDLKRQGFAEIFRVLKPGGLFLLADFNPPANPILNHVTSALVGPQMMQSNVQGIPPMLAEAGFVEVASGPTRSAFLAFVSGKKPVSNQPMN